MEDFVPYLVFIAMTITFWFVTLKATTKSPKHGSIISTIVFALIVGFMMIFASIQASEATKQAANAASYMFQVEETAEQLERSKAEGIAEEARIMAEQALIEAERQASIALECLNNQ
ncbi:MAG: hypothetical protein RJQ09_01495 [Cyclobacteriaceae bacterium]